MVSSPGVIYMGQNENIHSSYEYLWPEILGFLILTFIHVLTRISSQLAKAEEQDLL